MGIFIISLIGDSIELGFTNIKGIDADMAGSVIHVRGVVKEFKEFSAGVKMLIEQESYKISVVYFTKGKILGKRNMCADVVGEVKTTNGALEIDASSVFLFIC